MKGPHDRLAGLSPLVALAAGAVHRADGRPAAPALRAPHARPGADPRALGVTIGLGDAGSAARHAVIAARCAIDALTLALMSSSSSRRVAATLLAGAVAGGARRRPRRVPRAAARRPCSGMVVLAGATDLVTLFIGFELLSIPLYVLCATELRREHSLESGLKYLIVGSVGSATLVYGLALLYGATGATDFAAIAARRRAASRTTAAAHRPRAVVGRPRLQGVRRALPPVDAGRLRGRADAHHGVHGGRDQGGRVRRASCGSSTWR